MLWSGAVHPIDAPIPYLEELIAVFQPNSPDPAAIVCSFPSGSDGIFCFLVPHRHSLSAPLLLQRGAGGAEIGYRANVPPITTQVYIVNAAIVR